MFNASAIESNLFIVAFILAFSSLLIYELSCPIINDNSSCLKPDLSRIFFKFSKRRQNLGLSYTKMHKLSQIDIRAIKALENGNKNVTLKTILRLLNVLKLNIVEDDLIF